MWCTKYKFFFGFNFFCFFTFPLKVVQGSVSCDTPVAATSPFAGMATTPPTKKKVSLSFPSSLTALSRTHRPPCCTRQHPLVLPLPSTPLPYTLDSTKHLDKFFFLLSRTGA